MDYMMAKTRVNLCMNLQIRRLQDIKNSIIPNGVEGSKQFVKKVFIEVMEEKPHLINEYKRLVDNETIKEVLKNYPLTKLYLKD